MDKFNREIGKKLKQFRTDEGLTQSELGDAIGVSRDTITKIEGGRGGLTLKNLVELCERFEVSCEYFLGSPENGESSIDEKEVLRLYRSLPEGLAKEYALVSLRSLAQHSKSRE